MSWCLSRLLLALLLFIGAESVELPTLMAEEPANAATRIQEPPAVDVQVAENAMAEANKVAAQTGLGKKASPTQETPSKKVSAKKVPPKKVPPKKVSPKKAPAKKEGRKAAIEQRGAAEESPPARAAIATKQAPGKVVSKGSTPEKTGSKDAVPKKEAPKKEAPKKVTPKRESPKKVAAKKRTPDRSVATKVASKETAAKKPASASKPTLPTAWVKPLQWRSIGPANMSGRIPALAVCEENPSTWWVASASGGLLKTVNNGTTFEHQFDHEATVSIGDVQVAASDPNIVWVGTGEANPRNSVSWGDGVYKSTDGGKTWKNMGLKKAFQIGRIAIHPKDPNIVYVGTLGRLWGPNPERGLFKTTDGGKTWKKILYVDDKTGVIDVQMNLKNPDTLIVATYRRERDEFDGNDPATKFGPGAGVFVTKNGGRSFKKVTKGLPNCNFGRIGISIYRKDPRHVYLVLESEKIGQTPEKAGYAGIRGEDADIGARLIEVVAKGPAEKAGLKVGDIIYGLNGKTIHSYAELIRSFDVRQQGDKIKLTVSRERKDLQVELVLGKRPKPKKRSQRGAASTMTPQDRARANSKFAARLGGQRENQEQGPDEHVFGGIYHSRDGGMSWERINSLNPRPMYYSQIRVDPSNNKNIWVLGTSLYLSKDGGGTFTSDNTARGIHVDHHSMWIDPRDSNHVILGNDGGIHVTYDQGAHWDHLNHVAIGQFYHVAVGPRRNYRVFGGLQDNGSWGALSRGADGRGAINTDWFSVGGGDGFVCAVDPEDPELVYSESQLGIASRYDLRTGRRSSVRPRPPKGTRYRFNWKTPFILSTHNSRIYYNAGDHVFRSPYKGNNLQAISPKITLTDKGTASALAESPVEEGVLYVGTTDGALWGTKDGGHTWMILCGEQSKDLTQKKTTQKKTTQQGSGAKDANAKVTKEPPKKLQRGKNEPAGKQTTVAKTATPEKSPSVTVKNDVVSGTWEGRFESENMPAERAAIKLVLRMNSQGRINGTFKSAMSEGEVDGKFDPKSNDVTLTIDAGRAIIEVAGTVSGKEFAGDVDVNNGAFTVPFTAQRTGDAPAAAKAPANAPKLAPGKSLGQLLPGLRWFSSIEASRFKNGRVYVTCDGHRSNDDKPYLFVSDDYGHHWRSLLANLPDSIGSTRVIREDVKNENVLYLGTEFSIWVSVDRGRSWTKLNNNLPTVAIHEIAIHPTAGEIVAATHGRSLWVLDVAALRQLSAESIAAKVSLYRPLAAVKWRSRPRRGSAGTRQFAGAIPPQGATIYYSLAKDAESVILQVTDIEGRVVRELEGESNAGLHGIQWDLRQVRPVRGSKAAKRSSRMRRGGTVPSGKYLVTLIVDDQQLKTVLAVEEDPDAP